MPSDYVKITPEMVTQAQQLEGHPDGWKYPSWKFFNRIGELAFVKFLADSGKKFVHVECRDSGCPIILHRSINAKLDRVKVVATSGPWQKNLIVGEARFLREMADFYTGVFVDMEIYYVHIRGHISARELFDVAERGLSKGRVTLSVPLANLKPIDLLLLDVENEPEASPELDRNEGRSVPSKQINGSEGLGLL